MNINRLLELKNLEKNLNYTFQDKSLLDLALTHPSYNIKSNDFLNNYQRLEFLGDSVLNHIISDYLFNFYSFAREGDLSKYRSILVKGSFLANIGKNIEVNQYIKMNKAEKKVNGQNRPSTIEHVIEAIIGAIYIDADFLITKNIVLQWYGDIKNHLEILIYKNNPKGILQEKLYSFNNFKNHIIQYDLVKIVGPDHNKIFEVNLSINKKFYSKGLSSSLKKAEELAASKALLIIKNSDFI